MDSVNGNYKSIGYAYSFSCGDGDYESEFYTSEDISAEVEQQIIDFTYDYTNCNHCGMRMRICVIVKDIDCGSIHIVGRDCGQTIDMFGSVASRLEGSSTRAMKIAKNKRDRNNFLAKHEGLKEALETKNYIIQDIRSKFVQYGKLSDKQITLIFKLQKKQQEFDKQSDSAKPIDFTEVNNVKLEVVSVKETTTNYGYYPKTVTKVLLKSEEGWKLYGNLTSSSDLIVKGGMVTITSKSISVSNKDKSFGFFKRAVIKKV